MSTRLLNWGRLADGDGRAATITVGDTTIVIADHDDGQVAVLVKQGERRETHECGVVPLRWTTTLPTEEGVYWYRNGGPRSLSYLLSVYRDNGALVAHGVGDPYGHLRAERVDAVCYPMQRYNQWAGPLPPEPVEESTP